MDQGAKIAAAVAVMLAGFAVAMLFRLDSPRSAATEPAEGQPLVLRKRIEPQLPQSAATRSPTGGLPPATATAAEHPSAGPSSPSAIAPPPSLARDYPHRNASDALRWPGAGGTRPPQPKVVTHKIVDGDTLQSLAEHYLGSADRHREIYDDNRNVLSSPELLPIGKKLKIVRRPAPSPSERTSSDERPMVPIER